MTLSLTLPISSLFPPLAEDSTTRRPRVQTRRRFQLARASREMSPAPWFLERSSTTCAEADTAGRPGPPGMAPQTHRCRPRFSHLVSTLSPARSLPGPRLLLVRLPAADGETRTRCRAGSPACGVGVARFVPRPRASLAVRVARVLLFFFGRRDAASMRGTTRRWDHGMGWTRG